MRKNIYHNKQSTQQKNKTQEAIKRYGSVQFRVYLESVCVVEKETLACGCNDELLVQFSIASGEGRAALCVECECGAQRETVRRNSRRKEGRKLLGMAVWCGVDWSGGSGIFMMMMHSSAFWGSFVGNCGIFVGFFRSWLSGIGSRRNYKSGRGRKQSNRSRLSIIIRSSIRIGIISIGIIRIGIISIGIISIGIIRIGIVIIGIVIIIIIIIVVVIIIIKSSSSNIIGTSESISNRIM